MPGKQGKNDPANKVVIGSGKLPCGKPNPAKNAANTPVKNASPKKPPTTITIGCEHRPQRRLINDYEIVPTAAKWAVPYKDTVKIIHTGPKPPLKLTVNNQDIKGGGTYSLPMEINPVNEWYKKELTGAPKKIKDGGISAAAEPFRLVGYTVADLFSRIWTYNHKKEYGVSGLGTACNVTIYNPEIWKLTIDLPPTYNYSVGEKVGSGKPADKEEETTPFFSEVKSVQLERSGAPVQVDAFTLISGILSIINLIERLMDLLQMTPQVGWYVDISVQAFQGTFEFEWGWKENFEDEKAYYSMNGSAKLMLISASVEFGFGFKVGKDKFLLCRAQLFAMGKGEVPLNLSVSHNSPDKAVKGGVDLTAQITVAVGGRVEVAYIVKLEATMESGLGFTGAFTYDSSYSAGFLLTFDINFLGVKGKLTWSVFGGGGAGYTKSSGENTGRSGGSAGKTEKVFLEPKLLKRIEWPTGGVSDKVVNATMDDIKNIIQRVCLDFIIFHEDFVKARNVKSNEELRTEIKNELAEKCDAAPISKTKKAIEGLALGFKDDLRKRGKKSWGLNRVTKEMYNEFVNQYLPVAFNKGKDYWETYKNLK
jgi:hypothetical protein